MNRLLLNALLYVVMLVVLLAMTGCATTAATPQTVLVPTPIPCQAAQGLPAPPTRTLDLDASNPGATVQAYAANRARWMGYADALSERLEACK